MATETTVRSIFCTCWEWPYFMGCYITFEEDGTGSLDCGIESSKFIAAEIEWKPLGDCSMILERKIDMKTDFQVNLDVEITLTKRALYNIPPGWINETNLFDTAFRPRIYKIELAKGRFTRWDWLHCKGKPSKPRNYPDTWYGLRVVFDQSPYPPLEEWKEETDYGVPWRAAKGNKFWEMRDLYRDTEESKYRPRVEDEKTKAERREKALEKLRRLRAIREEEE